MQPAPATPLAGSAPITELTPAAFPAATFPAPIPQPTAAFPTAGAQPFSALAGQATPPAPLRSGVDEWPQPKSRTPLVIGVVVVIAVIGGVIFFLTRGSDDVPAPAAPISALPPATPPAAHTSADTAATAEPTSADQGSSQRRAMDPPGSGPTATPNAGFAELFASGARRADERQGPSGPSQRFDTNAAKAALAAVTPAAAACRENGGPAGKATIVVTFEPSGKVSSATVSDAPFAGTSSGACIAAAMKRATVPAFSGLPGTVTKTISIQ